MWFIRFFGIQWGTPSGQHTPSLPQKVDNYQNVTYVHGLAGLSLLLEKKSIKPEVPVK